MTEKKNKDLSIFWNIILFSVVIISFFILVSLSSKLPPLKSGYTYKFSYLVGYYMPGLLPLVISSSILIAKIFLFSKKQHSINENNSSITNTKKRNNSNHFKKIDFTETLSESPSKIISDKKTEKPKTLTDDEIYDYIGQEIENNKVNRAIWTKSIADADGDKSKAEAIYIKHRFQKIKENGIDS